MDCRAVQSRRPPLPPAPCRPVAGKESRDLLAYLTGLGCGMRAIEAGENSANYMMEVTAGEAPDGRDYANMWYASEACEKADADIAAVVEAPASPSAPGGR